MTCCRLTRGAHACFRHFVTAVHIRADEATDAPDHTVERRTFFSTARTFSPTTIENRGKDTRLRDGVARSMGVGRSRSSAYRLLQMTAARALSVSHLFHLSCSTPCVLSTSNIPKTNGGYQWFNVDRYSSRIYPTTRTPRVVVPVLRLRTVCRRVWRSQHIQGLEPRPVWYVVQHGNVRSGASLRSICRYRRSRSLARATSSGRYPELWTYRATSIHEYYVLRPERRVRGHCWLRPT